MYKICLALPRFRNDRKEAISKNITNLAEQFSQDNNICVSTFTPTRFNTEYSIQQTNFAEKQDYASLKTAITNLIIICRLIRQRHTEFDVISLHIASPAEAFIANILLPKAVKKKVALSIWQTHLTFTELQQNWVYFRHNITRYLHIFVANSFLSAPIYRFSLKSFRQVLVHCEHQKKLLQRYTKRPIAIIQNAVFSDHNITERHFDTSEIQLLYIGHTKASKGVDSLLRIVALLRQKCKIRLAFAASGFGGMNEVKALVSELCLEDIVEFKTEINVFNELCQTHMLIVPLRTCVGTSLCPNVLIEAISVGTPFAVTDFPELKELLQNQKNGIVIEHAKLEESAQKIADVIMDENKMKEISSYQLNFFRQHLTLDVFSQKYMNALIEGC